MRLLHELDGDLQMLGCFPHHPVPWQYDPETQLKPIPSMRHDGQQLLDITTTWSSEDNSPHSYWHNRQTLPSRYVVAKGQHKYTRG